MKLFSWSRFVAVLSKEFVQMRRDRLTFAMIVGIPILQLILFGFAINTDPKALPTAVLSADNSIFSRSFIRAMENSGYFRVQHVVHSAAEGERLLQLGDVQFFVTVPEDFSRKLQRGGRPALLVEADATDPAATGNALAALAVLNQSALNHDLKGPLAPMAQGAAPFEVRVQRRYNPEGITQYNIVPGLVGTILTMTMVIMTSLAMTRERERGTMENLLATPVRPIEVMTGKIVPYIIVGYLQVAIILAAARLLFGVPMVGSLFLLSVALVVFIAANLAVGFTFSTLARNQLQAMQMAFFSSSLRYCFPVSCFLFVACRSGRNGWVKSCPLRISCAYCAAFCSRATRSPKSCRTCGRSARFCSRRVPWRWRATARLLIEACSGTQQC